MSSKRLSDLEAAALVELASRKQMALRIFRPLPHQEEIFKQPRAKYTLVCGGNRGGKTISVAALTAGIALDEKITFADGQQHECRMPWQKGRPLKIWLVCIDQRHIGEVLWPALFETGMFQVCMDPQTKKVRTYDPDTDKPLGIKPKASPPFIPKRFIESVSWESKADKIFNKVIVKDPNTGRMLAEIIAFTSKGDPPQGRAVDFIFIDEQLAREGYIDELKARIIDKEGQLCWSSWNDEDSEDLAKFNKVIDRELELESGVAKRITLTMSGNKMLSKQAIEDFLAGCATDEERLQRDLGIAPSEKLRMYPLFNKDVHTAILDGDLEDELSRSLRARNGMPPEIWTRYLILDPGTQNPAVLLCAVPPPSFGDYLVPYQEFYPGRMDPKQLASLVAERTKGQKFFQFWIDRRAGRQQGMGMRSGVRVADAYTEAFEEVGLKSYQTKSGFLLASDDVGGRQMAVQSAMHPNDRGLPRLRIVTHNCPELCSQLKKVKKDTVRKEVTDERKAKGQPHDVSDCLEYFVAASPRYVYLPPSVEDGSSGFQRYMKKYGKKKRDKRPVAVGTFY